MGWYQGIIYNEELKNADHAMPCNYVDSVHDLLFGGGGCKLSTIMNIIPELYLGGGQGAPLT